MTTQENLLAKESVRFFGEISASITHEIKNVLAIFNENSGLLQDLALMSQKGAVIDPKRLLRLSQSLGRQVKRADAIVRRMNRFAHSADRQSEWVELVEAVLFVEQLGSRLIEMKGAKFKLQTPESTAKVQTNRFFLENLLWLCMVRAMKCLNLESAIHIVVSVTDDVPTVKFTGVAISKNPSGHNLPTPQEIVLMRIVGAELRINPNQGDIAILFSQK